ncbi:4-hydroxy-tetrahydrodipicolinate reductase [bacterium BMS3Bbin03]|nr:4-hydroxy-tetrahydrodipicolinate reductase [bacterium BMS3Bbin03]
MKIGLLGNGRMGRTIEKLAVERGHTIAVIFEKETPLTPDSRLNGAEVLIDFSTAEAVPDNLNAAARLGIPVVEGTTGWTHQLGEMTKIDGLTVLYSPNFSFGVYVFLKASGILSRMINSIGNYDAYIHEWHHAAKADSPSGTAKMLAGILLSNLSPKEHPLFETSHGRIAPEALHVTSTRVGSLPGTHEAGFNSPFDLLTIRHQSTGREGFAYGALRAAEWLADRNGIFTMDDFMQDILAI